MLRTHRFLVVAALLALVSCDGRRVAPPPGPGAAGPPAAVNGTDLRIAGPFAHENLSVFLVCAASPGTAEYITLDEGLRTGCVQVSEKASEQVQELEIENSGDKPLFLQEGDRVKGGKQDRIVATSLVIAPRSGKTVLPSFCVEQSRWTAGAKGKAFDRTDNTCLAPKRIRQSAKMVGSQQAVWKEVSQTKEACNAAFATTLENSSLNEALDSPQVIAISEAHKTALAAILRDHPDAVGAAFVVNGRIEEVSVYPSPSLLRKLYPRLVESYAVQAALMKDKAAGAPARTADDIVRFMTAQEVGTRRTQQINAANAVCLVETEERVTSETSYNGAAVHKQWMSREKDLPGAAPDAIQTQEGVQNEAPVQQKNNRERW